MRELDGRMVRSGHIGNTFSPGTWVTPHWRAPEEVPMPWVEGSIPHGTHVPGLLCYPSPRPLLVTPESRARRVSQVVRATLASRDSTSRAEWHQAALLALR